jgi:hypothetical protein
MKKITLLLIISLISLLSVSPLVSAEGVTKTNSTIEKVATVFYDDINHVYSIETVTDENNGSWSVQVLESNVENKTKLYLLDSIYVGKTVQIDYTGDGEDATISGFKLIEDVRINN